MKTFLKAAVLSLALWAGSAAAYGVGTFVWPHGNPDVAISGVSTLNASSFQRYHVCTGGPYTITLPAATFANGQMIGFAIAPAFTGNLTIAPPAGTIDNAVNKTFTATQNVVVMCDGTNWRTVAAGGPLTATAFSGIVPPANGGTGINNGTFTLTVPSTGTAATLEASNVFTGTTQTVRHATTPQLIWNANGTAVGEIQNFGASGSLPNPGITIGDTAGMDVVVNRFVANNFFVCHATNVPDMGVSSTGQFLLSKTQTGAGTTGNQTINKNCGTIRIAAAGTTVTLTNSLISATSIIICTLQTVDATAKSAVAVPGAGSCVITLNAGSTGEVAIGFQVLN